MARTRGRKGKKESSVTGVNHERKQLERKPVQLPRQNRSALYVERKVPMEKGRLSAVLKMGIDRPK
jgi:hypothetical protein